MTDLNTDFDESLESVNLGDLCPMLQHHGRKNELASICAILTGRRSSIDHTERNYMKSFNRNEFQRCEIYKPGRILENIKNCSDLRCVCKILFAGEEVFDQS
eukprot:TRINITY_DN4341_c0_g1_i1.p2 TRINITY_DN4341_c0_g1~~TRINITY_DN4341_c0_g1_i1.p2  ORF type:complete len:102 (-),score=9.75 TRINITY_DN4341_c0_g1_i1:316-621(-)